MQLFSKPRSRSLTELTSQRTPPSQDGHAPPPIKSRRFSQNPQCTTSTLHFWQHTAQHNPGLPESSQSPHRISSTKRLWHGTAQPWTLRTFIESTHKIHNAPLPQRTSGNARRCANLASVIRLGIRTQLFQNASLAVHSTAQPWAV